MDKKLFIDQLTSDSSAFTNEKQARGFANLLNTVSTDIYSESQRFVFELIQNADDSAENVDNQVHFECLSDALIVSHNGKAFSPDDINSITDAGSSTKISNPNKTGYKGIGFKSVFGRSNRVSIFSDGYQFRFDKDYHDTVLPWQIIPIWSELSDYSASISNCLSQSSYNVSTVIELNDSFDLATELKEILKDGQILLFLRAVDKIIVSIDGIADFTVSKHLEKRESVFDQIKLFNGEQVQSEWLFKRFDNIPIPSETKVALDLDQNTPEKLRQINFTELSFAAKLVNGKINPISHDESIIYTYLPTKVKEFGFPFLVNSAFMTSAAREALFEDRVWNQWLFEITGDKIMDWLSSLATTSYRYEILNILPSVFTSESNQLKKKFNQSFLKAVPSHSFITCKSGAVRKITEVIIDKTGLSLQSFLDESSIISFICREMNILLPTDCFVHAQMENQSKLAVLGVGLFDQSNIGTYFESEEFIESHIPEANFELMGYLKTLSDEDNTGVWFQTLKHLPFIFDDGDVLRKPLNGICFPTGLNTTELGEMPVMNQDIYRQVEQHDAIYKWLTKLGIKEPSNVAYVTNVIIPNLGQPGYINEDNYFQVTNYLYQLYNQDLLDSEMLEGLRELPLKVIGPPVAFHPAQECFLSSIYRPKLSIQNLITSVNYVSTEYLHNNDELSWNKFFKAIKVKEDIEIEVINENNTLTTLNSLTHSEWVNQSRQKAEQSNGYGFGTHNKIGNLKIPTFLKLTAENFDYAVLFWRNLIDGGDRLTVLNERARYRYGVGNGENRYWLGVENYFSWFVSHIACIPTTTGELKLPSEVLLNKGNIKEIAGKYLPVFEFDRTVPIAWQQFFNMRDHLKLEDYFEILELMWRNAESDEETERASALNVGMIYNELAKIIENMAEEDKTIFSEWAKINKLLCQNDTFFPAEQLMWVDIAGFSTESSNLKTIWIPSNARVEMAGFEQLMELFGVQVINEFLADYDDPIQDISLLTKLEQILPIIVALAAEKKDGNSANLFDKAYDKLNSITFYSAKEIKLYFEYDSQRIEGPTLSVYRTDEAFYFRGRWRKERTLLDLVKELTLLIGVKGLESELRFLLMEEDANEIREWCEEKNLDPRNILSVRRFRKQLAITQHEILVGQQNNDEYDGNSETMYAYLDVPTEAQVNELFLEEERPFEIAMGLEEIDFDEHSFRTISSGEHNQPQGLRVAYAKPQNEQYRTDVGYWSEKYINKLLLNSPDFGNIRWQNEDSESGRPYDFIVECQGMDKFIEVKGTASTTKNLIYLSSAEWNQMYESRADYILFRVYGAGTPQHRFEVHQDPFEKIQKGEISVALEL